MSPEYLHPKRGRSVRFSGTRVTVSCEPSVVCRTSGKEVTAANQWANSPAPVFNYSKQMTKLKGEKLFEASSLNDPSRHEWKKGYESIPLLLRFWNYSLYCKTHENLITQALIAPQASWDCSHWSPPQQGFESLISHP